MQVWFLAGLIILVTIILAVIFVVFLRLGDTLIKVLPKLSLLIKAPRNWKKIQKTRYIPKKYVKYGKKRGVKQKGLGKDRGMREDSGDQEDDFGWGCKEVSMSTENSAWVTTPTPTYQESIDKALKELPIGQALFNTPPKMKVGVQELLTVRITQNMTEDLRKGLKKLGESHIEKIKVGKYMKVRLTGSAFKIDPEISEPQIIESDKYTVWQFYVTPLKSGIQTLHLFYYVIISIADYSDKQKAYKVGDRKVNVKVNPMYFLKCYWQFIVGTLIAIVALIITIIGIM